MAAEEDGDVFEITDFTTASEWERFVARLEEVLHEWKLVNRDPLPNVPKGKFTEGPWVEKTEEVLFADFKFLLTYTRLKTAESVESEERSSREREEGEEDHQEDEHKTPSVMNDIISTENDFPSRAHCLCRWYGLQEFLIIQPAPNFGIIDSESRAKILESSAAVACSNSACHVPVFIQLQQKWRKLYSGMSVVPGGIVNFDMSHLKKLPPRYLYLDGLLNIFKGKLGCEYVSMPPVSVSVRFTYILEDWIHCPWPQLPPDFSSFSEGEVGFSELDVLPFGACEDPISELHLSCTWPYLSADMIVESSTYTDLDPMQAPQWSVRLQMTEDPQCLLGQYLRAFMELCGRPETTDEILGRLASEGVDVSEKEGGDDITNALHRLTEPNLPYHIPTLGSVVSRASSRLKIKPEEAPIPLKLLNQVLLHLFPDATGLLGNRHQKSKADGCKPQSKESTPQEETPPQPMSGRVEEVFNEALKQLKSAPPDSLTYRLAVCFAILNFNHGGVRAIAHLWQEFILEMRYRWENSILIPDLGAAAAGSTAASPKPPPSPSASSFSPSGVVPAPNLGSCLLHQKLQMLNCCIERRIKREASGYGHEDTQLHEASTFDLNASTTSDPSVARKLGSVASSSDDDDDEFFECDEGEEEAGDAAEGKNDNDVDTDTFAKGQQEGRDGTVKRATLTSTPEGRPRKKLSAEMSVDSSMSEASFKDATLIKPEGRLAPMKNMFSLTTLEQLYIPVTQEPSPMTEDMLEEQAEVLAKLGSSAEGSNLRARMQSACLLSDMESFKAANPGCCLEDFVRWYSPRDFIEEEEEEESGSGGVKGRSEGKKKDQEPAVASPSSTQSLEGKSSALHESKEKNSSGAEACESGSTAEYEEDSAPSETSRLQSSSQSASEQEESGVMGAEGQESCDLDCDSEPKALSSKPSFSVDSVEGSSDSEMPKSPCQQAPGQAQGQGRRVRGRLSQRMQIVGNMWVEVWQSARPVPARRQKRLFDDTKEAEKVLHFLAGLRPSELAFHLMPVLAHAAALKLAEHEDPEVPVLRTLTDQVMSRAAMVTRGGGSMMADGKRYEDVVRMVEVGETVSSRAQSLKTKLTRDLLDKGKAEEELHRFVASLLQTPEVDVRGGPHGPAGAAIHKLFTAAQKASLMILEDEESLEDAGKPLGPSDLSSPSRLATSTVHDFPNPSAREYILRAMVPRPAPYSRVLPQRMYCVLVEGDFRLAGAFCSDTTFQ